MSVFNHALEQKVPSRFGWGLLKYQVTKLTDGSHHSPETTDAGVPYVTVSDIGINTIDLAGAKRVSEADARLLERNGCRPYPGDLLLTKDGTIGRAAVVSSPDRFVVLSSLGIIRPTVDRMDVRYLRYCLLSSPGQHQMFGALGGAALTRLTIEKIKNLRVLLAPLATQKAIAAFLDRKTAAIDALIEKKQKLLDLLAEKRAALINQAVTKGLDPNVPMKDSGIPWIGEIPAHWEVKRGRFLCRQMQRPPGDEDGVVTAFRDGEVTLRSNRRTDGFTLAVKEVGYQRIHPGDLVIHSMDAFAGAIGVSDSEGKATGEYVVCTPFSSDHDSRYFAAVLRWMAEQDYIFVICPSVRERAPRFRYSKFKDVLLPVPPAAEQRQIMDVSLESASTAKESIAALGRHVELLKEYRQALITAAVTGQLDIGEEAA